MDKAQIMGMVRHVLTTLGGILASKGYIGESDVEIVVGAVVIVAGALWSVMQKKGKAA